MAEDPLDLFGEHVQLEQQQPALVPDEPLPNGIDGLEGVVKEAVEAAAEAGAGDDLFGDDDNASVATEQLEPQDGLTEEELAARRKLEYTEEEAEQRYVHHETFEERTATVQLSNLAAPCGADGKMWHIKLPTALRLDDSRYDELSWEEPAEDAEDFPEENVIRWRIGADGQRESNARIIRWSDGSQSLQVGEDFFEVITSLTDPTVKAEDGATGSSAGVTLLVGQHLDAGLVEAAGIVTGTMTFTPYSIGSMAHRRLANRMADKQVSARVTQHVKLEQDPELEKQRREKAEAERAKAVRKERAKAAGPRRKRRGLRSMRIDRSDDEAEEPMDYSDSGEEDTAGGMGAGTRSRRTRPSYLDGPDEDDERFIVDSDQEGGPEGGARNDAMSEDEIDRLEAGAERATRKKGTGLPSSQTDTDPPVREEPREEATFVRRKLVVGGDSDED